MSSRVEDLLLVPGIAHRMLHDACPGYRGTRLQRLLGILEARFDDEIGEAAVERCWSDVEQYV